MRLDVQMKYKSVKRSKSVKRGASVNGEYRDEYE